MKRHTLERGVKNCQPRRVIRRVKRALTRERVLAGLAAAKRRVRKGGRPPKLNPERVEQIVSALDGGAAKASRCRSLRSHV